MRNMFFFLVTNNEKIANNNFNFPANNQTLITFDKKRNLITNKQTRQQKLFKLTTKKLIFVKKKNNQ